MREAPVSKYGQNRTSLTFLLPGVAFPSFPSKAPSSSPFTSPLKLGFTVGGGARGALSLFLPPLARWRSLVPCHHSLVYTSHSASQCVTVKAEQTVRRVGSGHTAWAGIPSTTYLSDLGQSARLCLSFLINKTMNYTCKIRLKYAWQTEKTQ